MAEAVNPMRDDPGVPSACVALGVGWLLLLTALNLALGGVLRQSLLFAAPVLLTAWGSGRIGLAFALAGAVSAWFGGRDRAP